MIAQRTGTGGTNLHGGAFKNVLEIVIVIDIETPHGRLPGSLSLPNLELIFAAGPRLQRQPAIGPQLSLGAETMGRLQQCDQERNPDGT